MLPRYVQEYFQKNEHNDPVAIERALKDLRRIRLHKTYEQYYRAAVEKKKRWAGKGSSTPSLVLR